MLCRRRFKNPKFILLGFILIFFVVFFLQHFQYEDIDVSQQFKQNHRTESDSPQRQRQHGNIPVRNKHADKVTRTIDHMKRIVHLDLKGSQPKLAYLNELIPFFKRAGATGVLIEYEDFFPYEYDLEAIRNQNHYTKLEITQILQLLKDSGLSVIPLIQTYGHLEFVLKLKQFEYLREDKRHFQAISPCIKDSYEKVLFRMIDQILENHPDDLEYIHIGCDEVYLMNKNPECKKIEGSDSFSTQEWFILHVSKIVNYIKTKRPYLNVMIWDDMIRKGLSTDPRPNKQLAKFAKTVVPMIWDYNDRVQINPRIIETYEDIFSQIWIASAFKGATSHLELMPNITKHYNNQLSWLSTIGTLRKPLKLKGVALTGWSRFDHMQSVCEIISAALPSLALCLQAFSNYDKTESITFLKSKDLTECNYNGTQTGFILDPFTIEQTASLRNHPPTYTCQFPGANLYKWLLQLKLITQHFEYKHAEFSQILNEYNLKNNFFNSLVLEKALAFYGGVREKLKEMEASGEQEFDKLYYSDLYEEITQVYIVRWLDLIDRRLVELGKVGWADSAPNRPFNKISHPIV